MRIELLWWDGCPSHPEALAELRQVLTDEGLDPAQIESVEIETDEQAARESFPGSPTIRVQGRDIAPAAGNPVGLACRVYRTADGRSSPTPDPEEIRAALRREKELH